MAKEESLHLIRVLLVDDHEVVRAGYCRLLENTEDIKVIAEARSGEEAYLAYVKHQPNVVIMDLSMPGMGGLEAVRKIKHYQKLARILVFSVHENEIFLTRAIQEGVLGYISKRSAAKVMVEAVRQVAQGKVFIGQEMQPY
ncbi:MAG: response regulator transcription factor, partial [Pseudomonadota bacterium]|nr:response regulator transcription factor [Pseudomonadota bacterium]